MTISLFSILLLAPYPTRWEGSCSVSLRKRPFGPSGWGAIFIKQAHRLMYLLPFLISIPC